MERQGMAVHVSKTTLSEYLRIAWRSVGSIISRAVEERSAATDRLDGLRQIGIDEVSFRKGQQYLTVVVDHESSRVVWAAEGRDEATLERFFDLLGPKRSKQLRFVTADGASWIGNVLARRCPQATVCLDPFHVVSWATNAARRAGHPQEARQLKNTRYALWKNPEDLTRRQGAKLADIARRNKPLYIADHRPAILDAIRHGLSNARVESVNTRIRMLTRIAFGFHSATPLIALVMLARGGLCPPLPGRS